VWVKIKVTQRSSLQVSWGNARFQLASLKRSGKHCPCRSDTATGLTLQVNGEIAVSATVAESPRLGKLKRLQPKLVAKLKRGFSMSKATQWPTLCYLVKDNRSFAVVKITQYIFCASCLVLRSSTSEAEWLKKIVRFV
jgi:hypothetical protein